MSSILFIVEVCVGMVMLVLSICWLLFGCRL